MAPRSNPTRAFCAALAVVGRSHAAGLSEGTHALHSAVCDDGCQLVRLGDQITDVRVSLEDLCDQHGASSSGYICNVSLIPACAAICEGQGGLKRRHLQRYLDDTLASNPFRGPAGERLDLWVVPQTDLSADASYAFVTQRQALYVALRILALKMRFPNSTVVSGETNAVLNALEYGLTYGCNWRDHVTAPPCATYPMYSGVDRPELQGNIFSLLAWSRALAAENGAGSGWLACYVRQRIVPGLWCPHDSVIGAVRGGLSGLDTKQLLDNPEFWKVHNRQIGAVGTRPNVCHFEGSSWVWKNDLDHLAEPVGATFCRGASDVPEVYGMEVEDFMSVDRPGTLTVDIAGAQYGGGVGSATGTTYATQDESMPVFYPETMALAFHSKNRSISTGKTALIFLGVRRYFSGQSGSHGVDYDGLQLRLYNHGNTCGRLQEARLLPLERLLSDPVETELPLSGGASPARVRMHRHSLGVLTSSCGTCADGNLATTNLKFRTAGTTCLVQWQDGRSGCGETPEGGWTFWMDVWIWLGALRPDFYPAVAQPALRTLVQRLGTGPWGAGVWFGNTLQYFVVTWLATALLWEGASGALGPQLDYYAYGAPGQHGFPFGGFCEQYQAQGYEDVVRRLPVLDAALAARRETGVALTLLDLYDALRRCSRCESNCTFPGAGPPPANIYCTSECTDDFLSCFASSLRGDNLVV